MGISQKQVEANRRNAQKSTGPRSEEGKAASSRNALKHGVLSDVVVAQGEDGNLYRDLLDGLFQEFNPQTPLQENLVERLALLLWRERRLSATEQLYLTRQSDNVRRSASAAVKTPSIPNEDSRPPDPPYLHLESQLLIGRYQAMLSNQIKAAIKLLREEKDWNLKADALDVSSTSGLEPSNDV